MLLLLLLVVVVVLVVGGGSGERDGDGRGFHGLVVTHCAADALLQRLQARPACAQRQAYTRPPVPLHGKKRGSFHGGRSPIFVMIRSG